MFNILFKNHIFDGVYVACWSSTHLANHAGRVLWPFQSSLSVESCVHAPSVSVLRLDLVVTGAGHVVQRHGLREWSE